ncbi:hypothetical protein [Aliiroseovarius sp.]|uniref:hypothetical protein n=1 Tax=Aliiroseovarius sp. TaxID=1872442 RepID=UPI0026355BD4|nr:hypothetical protein [Aliiroseovarius sp.]
MSNPESFINEVTEEVRRDKLYALMRRYGWIGVVAVVAIVGGAAFNEWRKITTRTAAEALGDAVLSAISVEAAAARAEAIAGVAAEGDAAAVLKLLSAAEAEGEAGRPVLESVAADASLSRIYRDLATLKLVLMPGAGDADARIAVLEPLVTAGAPYRLLAEEQLALAYLDKGETQEALDRLQQIWLDEQGTTALRRRAGELIVALGGTPDGA